MLFEAQFLFYMQKFATEHFFSTLKIEIVEYLTSDQISRKVQI